MKSNGVKHQDKHIARTLAVQFLYTKLFSDKESIENVYYEPNSILDIIEERKYDTDLYEKIVDGVQSFEKDIDETITELAPEWPIAEINPISLLILRAAIFEAFILNKTPAPIVIDEAIELKKEINPESSTAFINGVLGSIVKNEVLKAKLAQLYVDETI